MKKALKIFWLFSKYSFKTTWQQPMGVFLFIIGKLVRFSVLFLFLVFLFKRTRVFIGYSASEALIFFLTFNLIDTATQLFFREVYRFRQLVVSAELDTILVKPYHPFLRVLLGGIDYLDAFVLLIYFWLLVFYLGQLQGEVNYSWYALLLINSFLIGLGFHILVLALGILTTEVDHTIMIYRDATRLGAFPIDIYQEPVKSFFTFLIPVGVMMTFPVKGLLNLLSWPLLIISLFSGIGILIISLSVWRLALKKYQSWGG
jgi:ABC-2 type transport system permease protein